MFAFLTGSRVYGTPKPKSDVDLVIRVSESTAARLRGLSDNTPEKLAKKDKAPIRFGRLNLIVCTTDEEYAVWKVGTVKMERTNTPHNRDDAKAVFDELREVLGLIDKADSGGPYVPPSNSASDDLGDI